MNIGVTDDKRIGSGPLPSSTLDTDQQVYGYGVLDDSEYNSIISDGLGEKADMMASRYLRGVFPRCPQWIARIVLPQCYFVMYFYLLLVLPFIKLKRGGHEANTPVTASIPATSSEMRRMVRQLHHQVFGSSRNNNAWNKVDTHEDVDSSYNKSHWYHMKRRCKKKRSGRNQKLSRSTSTTNNNNNNNNNNMNENNVTNHNMNAHLQHNYYNHHHHREDEGMLRGATDWSKYYKDSCLNLPSSLSDTALPLALEETIHARHCETEDSRMHPELMKLDDCYSNASVTSCTTLPSFYFHSYFNNNTNNNHNNHNNNNNNNSNTPTAAAAANSILQNSIPMNRNTMLSNDSNTITNHSIRNHTNNNNNNNNMKALICPHCECSYICLCGDKSSEEQPLSAATTTIKYFQTPRRNHIAPPIPRILMKQACKDDTPINQHIVLQNHILGKQQMEFLSA